jgi:hypothetical protein
MFPRPAHVENRFRSGAFDRFVKESDVLVHPLGILDRQRALLLEHDTIVIAGLDLFQGLASVPMRPKRGTVGADEIVLEALSSCCWARRAISPGRSLRAVKLFPMKRAFRDETARVLMGARPQ